MRRSSIIGKILRFFWHTLDAARKVMHLLLLLVFFIILMASLAPRVYHVPQGAALVVAPAGMLVEQLEGDPIDRAIEEATGGGNLQTQMRDLVQAIDRAAGDERIAALMLDLDGMGGGSLSKLQELGRAIDRFRDSGKPVVAAASVYGQQSYYLAARADQVFMHPMGMVILDGYQRYRMFYKEALDKLSIDWNVFRVGAYKSFAEPYTRNDMSEEDKQASREWLDALWRAYRVDVAGAREMDMAQLDDYIDRFLPQLEQAGGNTAVLALENRLVDGLKTWPEVEQHMEDLVGLDEKDEYFKQIHFMDYLDALNGTEQIGHGKDQVAVIVASGSIVGGDQPPGTIGADSTVQLIRRAATDEKVKAVVLRVDSGGGSAMASEFIREELLRLQATGKPLVVSMSSVAASGGYWIAMSADEIWASPNTITGSIGVVGMFPTFQRTLGRLGVNVDGVGTTPFSGDFRPDRALSENGRNVIQTIIDSSYQDFIGRVAEARGMAVEEVDRVGQGRVWTGARAQELGLVDQLGGLDEAVASAAEMAGLEQYQTRYIEKELNPTQRMLVSMLGDAGVLNAFKTRSAVLPVLEQVLGPLGRELDTLAQFNDPRGVYYHCFCGDR